MLRFRMGRISKVLESATGDTQIKSAVLDTDQSENIEAAGLIQNRVRRGNRAHEADCVVPFTCLSRNVATHADLGSAPSGASFQCIISQTGNLHVIRA